MVVNGINQVCIIGAGTMGIQIALQSARAGYRVTVYDISDQILAEVPVKYRQMLEMAKQTGIEIPNDTKTLAEIVFTTNISLAAKNADLISESVPENMALKQQIHAQFETFCRVNTIITTNTSSLSVSEIAVVLKRPERFAAMHFHSGLGPLVDVMGGDKTSTETKNTLKEFVKSIGLVPMVMRKEAPGYLFNNLLMAVNMTALKLAATGAGTPRDIDRAWMMITGDAMGPFGIIDTVGINVAYDISMVYPKLEEKEKIIAFLQPYIDKNELGMKTNKGFYVYPDPEYQKPDFLSGAES